jgi:CHAT domain-containing protein
MSATRLKFTPLDGAREEVERIIQVLRENHVNAVIYTDSEGTEESFKSLSGNSPSIIHIATHGFYLEDKDAIKEEFYSSLYDSHKYISPLKRCGLAFSGSQHAWLGKDIPETIEDGILTAEEIVGLNLTDTELLVLSACQTGLGHINDEGVEGLQKGFKMAGVNTIIMSLWKVNDHITQMMMTSFYEHLLSGKSKRDSFRLAQQEIRAEYPNPYQWAAFIMLD